MSIWMILSIVFAVIAVVSWVVTMLVNWTEEKTKIVSLIMAIVVLLFAAGGIACTVVEKCEDGESTVEAEQEPTTNNLSGQNGQFSQTPQTTTEPDSQLSTTTTTQDYQANIITNTTTTPAMNNNIGIG